MSQINVNTITGKDGGSAVNFPNGITVTGVVTATQLTQNVTGDITASGTITGGAFSGPVTGNVTGNVTSSGANTLGSLTVSNDATITGNLTVNGTTTTIDTATLSVEDANIGIGSVSTPTNTTANGGGLTVFGGADGDKTLTWNNGTPLKYWALGGGYLQSSGIDISSLMREGVNITSGKLSDNLNIDLENGMVHYFTTTETTTSTPNIRYNASTSLASVMNVGEAVSVTLMTNAAAAAYSAQLTIDGGGVTEEWSGATAPTAGGAGGIDLHTYTIVKTGSSGTPNNDFLVLGTYTNFD